MKAVVLEAKWDPRQGYTPTADELETQMAGAACHVWRHPHYQFAEITDPSPGPGEVLVQVVNCGVCGSDTHCYETDAEGYLLFSGPARLPVVPGHEYSGVVGAVGEGVSGVSVGDLVAAVGMLYCGVCESCRSGYPNQCPSLQMVGFSSPGAYAEYILVEERFCWSLNGVAERLGDRRKALELGALVEPIACSYNGLFVAGGGMRPGDHVAVFGAGPIGLGAIALARTAGAATITAFDLSEERCRLACAVGADEAYRPDWLEAQGSSAADRILEQTRGWGADRIFECAGAAVHTMPQIERAFAPGGRMIYLGRTGERAPVLLDVLVSGAASITGARGHAGMGCFPHVIRLLEHDRIVAAPMITSRQPFSSFLSALEQSCTRTDGKILICYD